MKKGGGSESTIIIGPSKSVLVYALHSWEYVLGLAWFRAFVPKLKKTSKEAIVGRARLWKPISFLCQLNKTIILFGSNFGYLRKKNYS